MLLLLCIMPGSDSDPEDFSLSQDNDFSGSANAKFAKSMSASVRVYRRGENPVSHSVPVLGPGTALVR